MKHVRHAGLVRDDMKMAVDLVGIDLIKEIIKQSGYERKYSGELNKIRAIEFLQTDFYDITEKSPLKKFYKTLKIRIEQIDIKLNNTNPDYLTILGGKRLKQLRELFEKAKLTDNQMKAIPILLKCHDIEYTKSIAFTIENELYIRSRIRAQTDQISDNSSEYINKINKLTLELKESEVKLKIRSERIAALEKITRDLELELTQCDPEVGYYSELTQTDYVKVIEDLGKHSIKIKDKFKQLIQKFEENENKPEYKLYEIWMEWTDDEVTILDSVLKKSMYEEVIKRSDIYDLENISENIMNRYLLSRLLLHLIYRRMSSHYWEEVFN